jgi:uncharacterized damage-inducible protein DinB
MKDIRYPIGTFTFDLNQKEQKDVWIQQIEALPDKLSQSISELDHKMLERSYRPGGWTLRQVIHHIADSHLNGYTRFKLALTEEAPTIKPYHQDGWADLADSKENPAEVSLLVIQGLHARWAALAKSLSEEQLNRTYINPESGEHTLYKSLALYAWHGNHHLAHITTFRERNNI